MAIVLALCLVISLAVPSAMWKAGAEETGAGQVVIYHTNDTHGYLSGDGSSVIGIDQVAGLKESTPGSIPVSYTHLRCDVCGNRHYYVCYQHPVYADVAFPVSKD